MNLKEIQPEDLIQPEWLDTYKKNIEVIWKQIIKLNSNRYCVKRITEFPFDLFEPIRTPFWLVVLDNMIESSIMIIYKILIDSGSDTLTLRSFKNEIIQHFEEEFKPQFKIGLKAVKFGKIKSELEIKIRDLRNNYLAHFKREFNAQIPPDSLKKLTIFLPDIYDLTEKINTYFQLLCFGYGYAETYFAYSSNVIPPLGADPRSDIEIILDTIAEKSDILNMPEKQPWLWEIRKKSMSPKGIDILNHYRYKFGLNKV